MFWAKVLTERQYGSGTVSKEVRVSQAEQTTGVSP